MPFPVIPTLPTAPSPDNPASFNTLAYPWTAALGPWTTKANEFGTAMNNYVASGVPFATGVTGTANALVINLPERDAALTNMFFFAPSLTNTSTTVTINLNGEGALPVRTPTGGGPPVGYVGGNNYTMPFLAIRGSGEWIVRRQDEYGTNANGEYWKFSNGLLICSMQVSSSQAINIAHHGGGRSATQTWTYPVAFTASPVVTPMASNGSSFGIISMSDGAYSTGYYAWTSITSSAAAERKAQLLATGRWY